MTALHIQHLCAGYGKSSILNDLSAQPLTSGKIIALLGPNGSGKSTLLKTIAGHTSVQRGSMMYDDVDLTQLSVAERAKYVMYMPQDFPSAVHLTVFESILVAAQVNSNIKRSEALYTAVHSLLQKLSISHLANYYLNRLSGGQRQLVGLAQALIRQPKILLLDEPLSALDLNYQYHVMSLLKHETKERGLITVIVLHDLNTALNHTDEALLLYKGHIVDQGIPGKVVTADNLARYYSVHGEVLSGSQGKSHIHIDGLVDDVIFE